MDTATAAMTITIRPVNDPPTVVGDTGVVDEGGSLQMQTLDLLANDGDAEQEALTISAVGEAVNGTVRLDGTTVSYVHDGSETSTGGFTYTVGDGADTATATVTITIRGVNDPPTAVDDNAVVDEGDTLVLDESVLLSNDSDAEAALKVSGVGNAVNGTVRLDGTTITFVHDGSATTSGGFTYTVSDGVNSATATVNITVRPVTDPPFEEETPLTEDIDAEDAPTSSEFGDESNGFPVLPVVALALGVALVTVAILVVVITLKRAKGSPRD